jgi:hypothetical protein
MGEKLDNILKKINTIAKPIDNDSFLEENEKLFLYKKRHYFLYVELEDNVELSTSIVNYKNKIKNLASAYWLLNEVGLYILFKVPSYKKCGELNNNLIDRTGFHAVVLQAVQVIGEEGEGQLIQSSWFGKKFGLVF